jgi:hypothetical protein
MSRQTTLEQTQTELTELVLPFAQLIDGPSWRMPTQTEYDGLRMYYDLPEHPDFVNSRGEGEAFSHGKRLPFTLALGLHPTRTRQANPDALSETYSEYASQRPLFVIESFAGNPDKTREAYQRDRTSRILANAIMYAGMNTNSPYSRLSIGQIEQAIEVSRDLGFLSRRAGKLLTRSMELTR